MKQKRGGKKSLIGFGRGGCQACSHSISTGSWKSSRLFVLSVAYFTRGTVSDRDVARSSEDR